MKKYIFSFVLLLIATVSFGQFEIGPRVGLGTAYTDISGTTDNITSGDAGYGFNVGLFTRIGSKKLKVMPEVLYTTATNNIMFGEGDGGQQVIESELDKVDIPIALQFKPISFLNLQGGIVGSYLVNDVQGVTSSTQEAITNYKDFTLGYQAGAGIELGSFLIDLKYETSGGDISDSIGPFEFDERQSMVKGMLGIKLF